MNHLSALPEAVFKLIESTAITEFATVSAAGVPIDTPTYYFSTDDFATIDIGTGLAYPAKAERARRNPKVGLLIEGGPSDPVVSIRGHAAVRDSNLQANAVRYISETGFEGISYGLDWSEARKAVWYWTRILVEITPVTVMWWPNPIAMDGPPHVHAAAAGKLYPESDPVPPGNCSSAPNWPQRPWQEIARDGMARIQQPHLTLCDAEGYPLPIRARSYDLIGDRFRLEMPRHTPWQRTGKATLTFLGVETFVGDVTSEGDVTWLAVERALPQRPTLLNPSRVLRPESDLKATLLGRLTEETARRGQAIPTIPEELPAPTRLAKLRRARYGISAPIVEGTT